MPLFRRLLLKEKIKERKATKLEVFALESNMKTSYIIVLCLREMAYPSYWNICSFIDDILPTREIMCTCIKEKKCREARFNSLSRFNQKALK